MADLRDLPAVRAEAERLANESWACCRVALRPVFGLHAAIEMPSREVRDAAIGSHLDLLCDLTRPASRDAVARLVAAKVGIECGATAPEIRRFRLGLPDGSESWAWALLGSPGEQFFFTDGNVPGISAITDPAEALRLIALHVLRSHDV